MKKRLYLITFLMIVISSITFFGKSQSVLNHDFDSLGLDQFDFNISGMPFSNQNIVTLDETDFAQRFGLPPVSNGNLYSEIDGNSMTLYGYNGAEVWYMDGSLQVFTITSPNYCFQLFNNISIKVGDNVNDIISLFPNSWANRSFNDQIFISLYDSTGPIDMTLLFQYDVNSNLITSISLQQ